MLLIRSYSVYSYEPYAPIEPNIRDDSQHDVSGVLMFCSKSSKHTCQDCPATS